MMPKPNNSGKSQNDKNLEDITTVKGEKVLYSAKPNVLLYCDNFIFKVVILVLLILLFQPILSVVYSLQSTLLINFQMDLSNLTFIAEMVIIFIILIIIAKLLIDVIEWNHAKYVLTNRRVIIQRGLFNKEKISMPYQKVQDLDVRRSWLERILQAGDIIIYGGHENSETVLDNIPNPKKVENIIMDQVNSLHYNNESNQNQEYNNNRGYNQNQGYQDYNQNQEYNNNRGYNQNQGYQDYSQNQEYNNNRGYKQNSRYNNQVHDQYQDYDDQNYDQNQDYNDQSYDQDQEYQDYSQNQGYNKNKKSSFIGYKNKWKNNSGKYHKTKDMDKETVIQRHQQQFKKYKKE